MSSEEGEIPVKDEHGIFGCCCRGKQGEEFIPESFKERKRHHTDSICFVSVIAFAFYMSLDTLQCLTLL